MIRQFCQSSINCLPIAECLVQSCRLCSSQCVFQIEQTFIADIVRKIHIHSRNAIPQQEVTCQRQNITNHTVCLNFIKDPHTYTGIH